MKKIKSRTAVLFKKKKIKLINLELPTPLRNQVLVKNIYSSICGTQMGEWLGKRNNTSMMPNCFGHEGVSKVIEIGKNVKKLKKDDIVCVSWIKKNNKDSGGIKIKNAKKIINAGPVNNFSDYSLISQNRLYKIKKNQTKKKYTLMGCAFLTAFNIFYENKIYNKKNINICIIGLGGLGLTCYYIAKYFGIKNIKCVEINRKKTDYLIRNFSVNKNSFLASDHKTNIKFDYVIDCVATKEVFSKNIDKLKNFGGKYIFLGNPRFKEKIEIDSWDIVLGKNLIGCWNKNEFFQKKFYIFLKYFEKIKFFNNFFQESYNLKDINKAFNDLYLGRVIRPIIKH